MKAPITNIKKGGTLKPRESDVQASIKDALIAAGFGVRHTSAFRQKGPSGVDKGVPDLLVAHLSLPGFYVGMEVKTPTGKPSPEQADAVASGEYSIVRKPSEALELAYQMFYDRLRTSERDRVRQLRDQLRSLCQ
jgi:hypothetical protein